MTTTPSKLLRLHNHPLMERQLNIPPCHVIIDADTFLALINIHGRYVRRALYECTIKDACCQWRRASECTYKRNAQQRK